MKLMIIESPNKINTLSKILGPDFKILATVGHMRKINDSGSYKTGIDTKNDFAIDYVFDSSRKENISAIKTAAKEAEVIYICSDGDREGELIADEVRTILKGCKTKIIRTSFNEITKTAVENALKNPTGFDEKMIEAANARGTLDKLVGYRVSPVARRVGGESAGRVQSALLELIRIKEESIEKFIPTKYYEVYLDFTKNRKKYTAKLNSYNGKKIDRITDANLYSEIEKNCEGNDYTIADIKKKKKLIEPKIPMTTSAMQQLASNTLGFSPSRSQRAAQHLYEKGYITYIRTDASRFAPEFIEVAEKFIKEKYGKEYYRGLNVPESKNKNSQNGHESIRPTDLNNTPAILSQTLDTDEYKLYKMIYYYALASFFVPAEVEETDVTIKNGKASFRITGHKITFESFLQFIEPEKMIELPAFKIGEVLKSTKLYKTDKETQPPPRYSEAGLVKLMESEGIGRPSTFSATIETLKKREYIKIEKKSVYLTEKGKKVAELLKKYFAELVDSHYTAGMEEKLDQIAAGDTTRVKMLTEFWNDFEPTVLSAIREINKNKPTVEIVEGKVCPNCGKNLVYREGKYGKFMACAGFPRCKYTEKIETEEDKEKKQQLQQPSEKIQCPLCGDRSYDFEKE